MSARPLGLLIAWEADERNSWTPALADELRSRGHTVAEVHGLDDLRDVDPDAFDVCLPRFRLCAANMRGLDRFLSDSGPPMLNGWLARTVCEDKGLSQLAFERDAIPQPRALVLSREGALDRALSWTGETIIKPLQGSRGEGVEILASLDKALARGRERREDLLVQQMIWPARSWRVIVGRRVGVVDPYWRRPASADDRVASVSSGATIVREPLPAAGREVSERMLRAVGGDLLAVDLLETSDGAFLALEINHNFDAHGGTEPAVAAFEAEMRRVASESAGQPQPVLLPQDEHV